MMGTHTITKVGVVKNSSTKQVCFSIILLERELHECTYQMKACKEHGMHAFLSHFQDEWNRIVNEIRTLLDCLRFTISTLCK
jgi:hypothetical protein